MQIRWQSTLSQCQSTKFSTYSIVYYMGEEQKEKGLQKFIRMTGTRLMKLIQTRQ